MDFDDFAAHGARAATPLQFPLSRAEMAAAAKGSFLRLAALLWLGGAPCAHAADLDAPAPGHPGLAYFDLMKLVVTDLKADEKGGASGHRVVAFTHIGGKDLRGDPPQTIELSSVDEMSIPGDPSRILLLADLGASEGFVANAQALALFALDPKPRLLDVVEVGLDRFTGFSSLKSGMLAARTPLILIANEHDNSDQSYDQTEMIFIRGDRFRLIDTIGSFGDAHCSFRRVQEPAYSILPSPGAYNSVKVRIVERVTATGQDCGDEKAEHPQVRAYEAIYHWDERTQRFATRSKALRRLEDENAKRF